MQFLFLLFLLNYIIMEYVVNALIFYVICILHLKHLLDLLQCYQMNFLLKEVFVKVVHYNRSYSTYFINDILNDCEKYGVNVGRKKCCGGLFADVGVLIYPSAKNLEKLLKKVHKLANLNEITFGIKKCATMVIKPMNFQSPPNYSHPSLLFRNECYS